MPQSIEGQARILLIEPEMKLAREYLTVFSEAGLDCRYIPTGTAATAACNEAHPHVVVLDSHMDDIDPITLCGRLHAAYSAPIIVLTEDEKPESGQKFIPNAADFLPRFASAHMVLSRVENQLRKHYHFEAVLPAEETPSHIKSAPPRGWGRCESCGYMGPRIKFETTGHNSAHSLQCPACKQNEDVTFSVS